jgi:hypothetical protein
LQKKKEMFSDIIKKLRRSKFFKVKTLQLQQNITKLSFLQSRQRKLFDNFFTSMFVANGLPNLSVCGDCLTKQGV